MEPKFVLSIDQCKELKDLGVDMKDATIYYTRFVAYDFEMDNWMHHVDSKYHLETVKKYITTPTDAVMTYTIEDLLRKMKPSEESQNTMALCSDDEGKWFVELWGPVYVRYVVDSTDTPIDALFNMYKWMLSHEDELTKPQE